MTFTQTTLVIALATWLGAAVFYFLKRQVLKKIFILAGWAAVAAVLVYLWLATGEPPMRSIGETRLWFAFFLPLAGIFVELLLRSRPLTLAAVAIAAVFVLRDLVEPAAFDMTMMPALRSPWFIPHVVAYMISYAALALAGLSAAWLLVRTVGRARPLEREETLVSFQLASVGFPFLTCGLLFGAFWAQDAWGDWWAWDPKEIWSLATWLGFAVYFHLRARLPEKPLLAMAILVLSAAAMMMTWLGIDILPSASRSIHIYGE